MVKVGTTTKETYKEQICVSKHLLYRKAKILNMYNSTEHLMFKSTVKIVWRPASPSVGHFRLNSKWGFIHALFVQNKAQIQQILGNLKHRRETFREFWAQRWFWWFHVVSFQILWNAPRCECMITAMYRWVTLVTLVKRMKNTSLSPSAGWRHLPDKTSVFFPPFSSLI